MAAVAGVVLLILVILGVRSYLNNRRDSALRSYNNTVTSIVGDLQANVSTPLFTLLADPSKTTATDINPTVQSYGVQAQLDSSRAGRLKVPGDMVGAQRDLVLALDLRAEALKQIADALPSALGTQSADAAIQTIAGQMEKLLASDVIYSQRVAPLIAQVLSGHAIGQPVAPSQFLPSLSWLDSSYVRTALTGNSGGTTANGTPKPGSHGHGLLQVTVGTTMLTPGTTLNQIKVTPNLTFDLHVANQGSNDETGVVVTLKLEGTSTTTLTKTIDTKAMTVQDVLIPLTQSPPAGNVKIVADVAKVLGEQTLSNNRLTFLASFTH